jgi:hypothetical protein
LVDAVNLYGVVSTGRSLEGAPVPVLIGGGSRIDDDPLAVDSQLEAEAVRVGMGRELRWAGRADVGDEVDAPTPGDDVARRLEDVEALRGRRRGLEERQPVAADECAVIEEGHVAIGKEHLPEPPAHAGDVLAEARDRRTACGPEERGDIHEVAQHLAVVGRRPLVVTPVGEDLDGSLSLELGNPCREQASIVEKHAQGDEGLQILDEMVAAHITLEVEPEIASRQREMVDVVRRSGTARNEPVEHAAQVPGAYGNDVRRPCVPAWEYTSRPPRAP